MNPFGAVSRARREALHTAATVIMEPYLMLCLLGGLLAVDDRVGWQSLAAQPVFTGLITGALLGEVQAGIATGVILELVWLSILPMRGKKRPDQVAGAVVGAGTSALLIRGGIVEPDFGIAVSLGTAAGLAAGLASMYLSVVFFRWRDSFLSKRIISEEGSVLVKLNLFHLASSIMAFLYEVIVVYLLLRLAVHMGKFAGIHASDSLLEGMKNWKALLPVFGIASLVQIYWHKYAIRFLLLSMFLALIVLSVK
jgi:mannose/fructose/N-acetylgalactosamine-specific phosphotransferase system component IIC